MFQGVVEDAFGQPEWGEAPSLAEGGFYTGALRARWLRDIHTIVTASDRETRRALERSRIGIRLQFTLKYTM